MNIVLTVDDSFQQPLADYLGITFTSNMVTADKTSLIQASIQNDVNNKIRSGLVQKATLTAAATATTQANTLLPPVKLQNPIAPNIVPQQ